MKTQKIKEAIDKKSYDCDPVTRSICKIQDCALYDFCTRKKVNNTMIRRYCRQCMNDMTTEIRECPSADCPFYPYRIGKNA